MRYAEYIPGPGAGAPAPDPFVPALRSTPGHTWILQREEDDRWTLRERNDQGVIGEPRQTSDPLDVIDATFWAGDLTDIGTGRWRPLVEHQRYEWQEEGSS